MVPPVRIILARAAVVFRCSFRLQTEPCSFRLQPEFLQRLGYAVLPMKTQFSLFAALVAGAVLSAHQAPQFSNAVRGYIAHAEPTIVLTNARVIAVFDR
jgi:hypothetical protein